MWDLLINPDSEKFRGFLVWLVDEKGWDAHEIIGVMYESHKYQKLEKEYLENEKKENENERVK